MTSAVTNGFLIQSYLDLRAGKYSVSCTLKIC